MFIVNIMHVQTFKKIKMDLYRTSVKWHYVNVTIFQAGGTNGNRFMQLTEDFIIFQGSGCPSRVPGRTGSQNICG
jgi:hypothetical protein